MTRNKTLLYMGLIPFQLNLLSKENYGIKMNFQRRTFHFFVYIASFAVLSHLLCDVAAVSHASSTYGSSSGPTSHSVPVVGLNTTLKPPTTLKPSSKLHYTLELTNSGPAVLDSKITFTAQLTPLTNESTENWPYRYMYQWMNMADMDITTTTDHLTSQVTITFSSVIVKSGEYPMTVAAFHLDDTSVMAAFQTRKFTLTDKLNGELTVNQPLVYQRFPYSVFSTNIMTYVMTYVMDHFQSSKEPSFKYKWYENGTLLKETGEATFTANFGLPTNLTMRSEVFAKVFMEDFASSDSPGESNQLSNVGNRKSFLAFDDPGTLNRDLQEGTQSGTKRRPISQDGEEIKKHYNKEGNFTVTLQFKDPLTSCIAYRVEDGMSSTKKSVATGSSLLVNVTCSGSIPSTICWKTTPPNTSSVDPCDPLSFLPTTTHQTRLTLNATGWVKLHFFVYNDVSRVHLNQTFYAYNPDSGSDKALYYPLIFGLLGIIIVIIGAAYIMRLRKKPLVEVADFDFHPSLTSSIEASNSNLRILRMMQTLKHWLSVKASSDTKPTPVPMDTSPYSSFSETPLTLSNESTNANHVSYKGL